VCWETEGGGGGGGGGAGGEGGGLAGGCGGEAGRGPRVMRDALRRAIGRPEAHTAGGGRRPPTSYVT